MRGVITAHKKQILLASIPGLAVLAAVLLIYSHFVLHPHGVSGRYDVARYFGPLAFYMDASIHHGSLPLWNPLTYCGQPFAANPQAELFYPPQLIRSLLNFDPTPFSTQVTLAILMGLHVLLAFWGTYFLARSHEMSRPGAATAAVAFTFSALMVRRVCEYHFITVLGWLPLLLLVVKKALDSQCVRTKLAYAVAAGILFGISTLGGFLQIVNYMAIVIAVYAVLYRVLHFRSGPVFPKPGRDATAAREDNQQPLGTRFWKNRATSDGAVLILVFVTGALIAAAMLLPASELAGFTARQKGEAIGLYSDLSKKPLLYLFQSLVVYPGMRWEPEAIRGSGALALLLSIVGLLHLRRRNAILFGVIYLVLVDCSFGPPFPIATVVNWLTPFAMSVYSRAYDVALLPLSLLAGVGVDAISTRTKDGEQRARSPGFSFALCHLSFVLTACVGLAILLALWKWTHQQQPCVPANALTMLAPIIGFALILAASLQSLLGVRAKRSTSTKERSLPLAWLIPIVVFAETLAWNAQYVPFMAGKAKSAEDPFAHTVAAGLPVDNTREMDPVANRYLYRLKPAINGYDPLFLSRTRDVVSGVARGQKYHRIVEAYEAGDNERANLFLKRPFWLARQYVRGPLPDKNALFPVATTVFLNSDTAGVPIPEKSIKEIPKTSVSENVTRVELKNLDVLRTTITGKTAKRISYTLSVEKPVQRKHAALCLRYTSTCPATIEVLFRDNNSDAAQYGKTSAIRPTGQTEGALEIPAPDFASATVSLTVDKIMGQLQFTDGYVLCDNADEDGLIRIKSWSPNTVEVETGELAGPRVLMFTDAAYPGWKAFVDSKSVPIYRANDAFKAVALSPGRHAVRFQFSPWRVYAGMLVSCTAFLSGVAAIMMVRPKAATV